MVEFRKRQKIRNIIYSKVTLFFLFLILVLFARSTYGLWQKERDTKKTVNDAKVELSSLIEKEASLSSRVASLKTERGVEEAIRGKFKVAKPGEGVVVVVNQKEDTNSTISDPGGFRGFLNQFLNLFK